MQFSKSSSRAHRLYTSGFDKGVVTHVRSFKEYVDDLEIFVAREVAQKITTMRSPAADEKFIYVANSMAGACRDDARIRCYTF